MKRIILIITIILSHNLNATVCNPINEKEYTQNSYILEGKLKKIETKKLEYNQIETIYNILPTKYYNETPKKTLKIKNITSSKSETSMSNKYEFYIKENTKYLFFINKEKGYIYTNPCFKGIMEKKYALNDYDIKKYLKNIKK